LTRKLISFDFAIKYLLRDKGNDDIIEAFISALLTDQGYKPVKILALLDTESNQEEYAQKKSLADLIVADTDHTKYLIEIERQVTKSFIHKSCFNASRLIVDQLGPAADCLAIKKVFYISLLYFPLGHGTIYHGKTIVRETDTKEKLSFHIEDKEWNIAYDVIDISPEYIFIAVPQFDDHLEKEIDEWLYMMKYGEVRADFQSPSMQKVANRLNILNMSQGARNEYLKYNKEIATYKDAIGTAKEAGIAEGVEIGMQQGMQKGIQQKKLDIATSMLKKGFAIKLIQEVTNLSQETIEELKK
jgi:predicted transposase/invertase (TIGR01784 family)